jgi:multiple sugar transport system substrate-binding protein
MFSKRSIGARRLSTIAVATAAASALLLTGCSGPGGGGSTPSASAKYSQADIDKALQKGAELTFWAWGPQYQAEVDAFNKKYPNMKVTLQNNGSNNDEYTKLQNVLKAGSGAPDLVQLEYAAMPQFALGGSLVNLNEYGLANMSDKFSASTWSGSQFNGALYGLPQDAGPMVMFYRQDVFDQFGLKVPTTWEEYIADAKKLHAADPSKFIAADTGDPGEASGLIWQAGGRPFQTSGENVTVNLADKGTKKWADTYQPLLDDKLVDTATAGFTPEWNAGLANGKFATLVTGAWAAGTLQRRIPDAAGKWRVAPMPQYEAGDKVSAQQGGSLTAITKNAKNKLAAVGFMQWIAADKDANKIWTDLGGFPTTTATLESSDWQNQAIPYFGGQKINKIFADASENVGKGWQFLPFQTYANSIFADTAGQAYVGQTTIEKGLLDWQKSIVSYGKSQGFQVK